MCSLGHSLIEFVYYLIFLRCCFLLISTSAIDCWERLVSEMTYCCWMVHSTFLTYLLVSNFTWSSIVVVVVLLLLMNDFQAPATGFVSTNSGFLASTNVMSPRMSSWHMPNHVTSDQSATDTLSSSLNDTYLSSYFTQSATLANDIQPVGNYRFSHVHSIVVLGDIN